MSLRSDSLLSVTGLFPRGIGPREHAASQTVPDTWAKRLRSWIKDDEPAPFKYTPPKDLDKLFEALAKPPNELEVAGWLEGLGIEDAELHAEYFTSITRARQYLVTTWPAFSINGPAGPQILPLSVDDAHEVWSLFQVLDDPERILDELDSLTLTPSQAEAFRTCYPDLFAHAMASVQATFTEIRAKTPDYDPGREKDAMLRTLDGQPPEEETVPPPPPPPAPEKLKIDPERDRTQAEVSSKPKGAD